MDRTDQAHRSRGVRHSNRERREQRTAERTDGVCDRLKGRIAEDRAALADSDADASRKALARFRLAHDERELHFQVEDLRAARRRRHRATTRRRRSELRKMRTASVTPGVVVNVPLRSPRPRCASRSAQRTSSPRSSASSGDSSDPPPPGAPALALAPRPRAILSYACLTAEQRGARAVEAGR